MTLKDGVGAWWGGLPCSIALGSEGGSSVASPLVYRRARGLEPSPTEVSFPRSMFTGSLAPAFDPKRFTPRADPPPDALGEIAAGKPLARPTVERPPYVGDLWLVQGTGEAQRRMVARALFLDQVVIATPRLDDPLVTFTLSDIRKWWAQHGEITREWNVRLAARTQRGSGQVGIRYTARSSRNGGRDSVPLREIVQELLQNLPGALPLVRWPKGVGEGASAPEVRCRAARPKDALRGIFDAYRLHVDIGPDLRVRVFQAADGEIGTLADDAEDNAAAYDPLARTGAWAAELTADGYRYARRPTGAPTDVLITGAETVYDLRLDHCPPVLTFTREAASKAGPAETVVLQVTPENMNALLRGEAQPEGDRGIPERSASDVILPDALDRHALNVIMGVPAPELPATIPIHPGRRNLTNTLGVDEEIRFTPDGGLERVRTRPQIGDGAGRIPNAPGVDGAKGGTHEDAGGDPVSADETPRAATAADPFAWQRIPLLPEDAWERALDWLPVTTRKLIRDQLLRYYQIPLTRYAPILARAERNADGERLEFKVYAFSFKANRIRERAPRRSDEDLERASDVAKLNAFLADRRRLEAEIKTLEDPDAETVVALLTLPFDFEAQGQDGEPNPEAVVSREELLRARERVREAALSWMPTLFRIAEEAPAVGRFLRGLTPEQRQTLQRSIAGTSRSRDATQQLLREDEDRLADVKRQATELQKKLYPRVVLEAELGEIEGAIRTAREATGEDPPDLVAKREAILAQTAIEAEKDKQKALSDARPDWEERFRLENLTRHAVNARLVDKARGIFEVLGEDLPVWVADSRVKHVSATYCIPMPVAIDFGSTCRDNPDGTADEDAEPENPYTATAKAMIDALPARTRALLGRVGHILPIEGGSRVYGERHVQLTFVRGGKDDGNDPIDATPWVEVLDETPAFRELKRLDGSSNRAALLERARPIARAILDTPPDTDAGSLILSCPQAVGANGRISAVEVRLLATGEGGGFTTEVSFDGDVEPLPDVPGRARDGGPLRLSFGIDPDGDA